VGTSWSASANPFGEARAARQCEPRGAYWMPQVNGLVRAIVRPRKVIDPQSREALASRLRRAPHAAASFASAAMLAAIGWLALAGLTLAQESSQAPQTTQPPEAGLIAAAALPRDLSPWGMFVSADQVVKGVLILLAAASLVTWTIWLAKTVEI